MKNTFRSDSARGSALAVSLLFTMVCAILAFSILRWSVTERRLNSRAAAWLSARNASEGVAEFGFSQVRNDFETQSVPASFKPGTANALVLPDSSIFAGGSVVTGALSTSNPNGMELIGGPVKRIPANTGLFYVDPANPNNQFDPLNSKWVFRQDVQIIARATVLDAAGNPITHYATETVSVRGAPLYAYAIFYNGDLEIAPGPLMDIVGPVHANGSIFASNQGSGNETLNFKGPVTCAGAIFHAWSSNYTSTWGSGNETLGQNSVTFMNLSGNQVSMKVTTNSTSTWKDSTMGLSAGYAGGTPAIPATDTTAAVAGTGLYSKLNPAGFRQYAAATWGGNLLTGASGILPYNPVSFLDVIDAAGNHPDPHVMIEPPNPPATTDAYYAAKMEVEAGKKSMQAGLYIKVVTTAAGTATISMYGPANSAPAGTPAANIGPNGGLLLTPPTNVANAPSTVATPPLVAYLPYRRKKVVTDASANTTTTTIYNAAGTVVSGPTSVGGYGGSTSTTTYSIATDTSTGSYGYGLYDQRRGLATSGTNAEGKIDLVQIDMKAVNSLVDSMIANTNDANAITYTDPVTGTTKVWNNENAVASGIISGNQTYGAEKQPWNGAVYIDVQAPNGGTPQQTTSVRLVNGTVAKNSSLIPNYGPNGTGLSLATNAPLYILGHFNADGSIDSSTSATPSSTTPDDAKNGTSGHTSAESPVALAADCITILSPGWSDANSYTLKPNSSGSVEIAAAFLVGLVKTANVSGGAGSGGAHNLPRFLENWSGDTVAIRGSLVTMFDCKIATQKWSTAFYGAPDRQWGYDVLFKNGVYPPYSPKVMSYRRVDFTELSAARYAAAKALMWP